MSDSDTSCNPGLIIDIVSIHQQDITTSFPSSVTATHQAGRTLPVRFRSATVTILLLLLGFVGSDARSQVGAYSPVTQDRLNNPPAGEWLSWRGNQDAWGYSGLDLINRDNVAQLELVWSWAMDDTGAGQPAPLVHDGILFLPGPRGVVQALDAASGDLLWEYRPGITGSVDGTARALSREALGDAAMPATAFAGVGRGVQKNIALFGERVYAATENASIVALDARTGQLAWETAVADPAEGFYYTAGPVIADGVLVTGITGCQRYKVALCVITGHDPDSGEELWRTSTVAQPGEPGGDSWGDLPAEFRAGSDSWIAGSYDPETGLVYLGTAQPKPWARAARGTDGDALYSNSTLALDPHSGEIVWYFQHLPGETHDMDEAFENVLVDFGPQKSLFKMGKLGILWQLDRETGAFIKATDIGYQNLVDVNPTTGAVRYRDGMIPRLGQQLDFCPSTSGVKSWRAMSYSPLNQALYIPLTLNCEIGTFGPVERALGGGGTGPVRRRNYPHPDAGNNLGELLALDLPGGTVKWRYRQRAPLNSAVLVTAGELVFVGDWNRYWYALDAESGEPLWQTRLTTSAQGFPISYAVDGRQYLALPVGVGGASWSSSLPRELAPELARPRNGNALFVYALPEQRP